MTNVADKLRTPAKKWPWFVGVPLVAVLAGGAWVGASALNAPTAAPTPTMTPYVAVLTADELDSVQAGADQQGQIIAADEKAAAEAPQAAQAAADAAAAANAAKSTHHASSTGGPIRCPAGSSANSNDGVNDTSCFPDICFGIPIPDPAHPECDASFKP